MTRDRDRLLGPCFKTGRRRRRPTRDRNGARVSKDTRYTRLLNYPPPAKLDSEGSGQPEGNPKLHPAAQSVDSGSSREAAEKYSPRRSEPGTTVLADPNAPSRPAVNLNLRRRLRERLRLPLHSFTYS